MFHGFHKNIKQHYFQLFLVHQISILEWFLKDHVSEDWSIDAENVAFQIQEQYDVVYRIFYV